MNFLMNLSPLIKVLSIFAIILILNKTRCNLGISMFIGTFCLALWFGLDIKQTNKFIINSILSGQTLILLSIIILILTLSNLMESCGQMKKIVHSFDSIFKKPYLSLMAMPALIGLLPMPGGAIFSAPMVDTIANKTYQLSPARKSAINHWFRHIWEYSWPLYPGIIMTVSITGIELFRLIRVQIPLTLAAILIGYIFIFRPIKKLNLTETSQPQNRQWKNFFLDVFPIMLVILTPILCATISFSLKLLTNHTWYLPNNTSIIIGLIFSLIWVTVSNKPGTKIFKKIILNKKIYSMSLLVASIMAFKGILPHSGAITGIKESLIQLNIPLTIVVAALPMVAGIVTGITIGFVGPAFPVVIELMQTTNGEAVDILPYIVLAFGFGFMGVMLSPVHLCFIMTKDFFRADMSKIYKHIFMPCLTMLIFVILMFWILKM